MEHEEILKKSWSVFTAAGAEKTLEVVCGDLCALETECDVVVCSSWVNGYRPSQGTLIGALYQQKGISVEALRASAQLDLQQMGCWLSRDTGTSFRRVACIELKPLFEELPADKLDHTVKRGLSTFRFLFEQASYAGIPTGTIATSIPGAGRQNIELEYILGSFLPQCKHLLEDVEGIQRIRIYERNPHKVRTTIRAIDKILSDRSHPQVFISYCSRQASEAQALHDYLEGRKIHCWMAPHSIPSGSNYLDEIPAAISQMKALLLLLTPDAENSRWVQKEVSSAIGANKAILPYKLFDFVSNPRFSFLLDGEQILSGNHLSDSDLSALLARLQELGC